MNDVALLAVMLAQSWPINWPAWIGAVASLGTLVIAGLALRAALRAGDTTRNMLGNDNRREDDRQRDTRAAQARLISAWIRPPRRRLGDGVVSGVEPQYGPDLDPDAPRTLFVLNASTAPVRHLMVRFNVAGTLVDEQEVGTLPPGERQDFPLDAHLHASIVFEAGKRGRLYEQRIEDLVDLELTFWDNAGQAWKQDALGRLQYLFADRDQALQYAAQLNQEVGSTPDTEPAALNAGTADEEGDTPPTEGSNP